MGILRPESGRKIRGMWGFRCRRSLPFSPQSPLLAPATQAKIIWASFCSWMNHYLDALTCINEDFYGTKWKRGDPV